MALYGISGSHTTEACPLNSDSSAKIQDTKDCWTIPLCIRAYILVDSGCRGSSSNTAILY